MKRRTGCIVALVALAAVPALPLLLWFVSQPWPISDPVRLKAIGTEARSLMAAHPARPPKGYTHIPRSQWPASIASLRPERVTVYEWGVDIQIKDFFDGGWGYDVGHSKRELPMLEQCYSEVGPGVFWHGPC